MTPERVVAAEAAAAPRVAKQSQQQAMFPAAGAVPIASACRYAAGSSAYEKHAERRAKKGESWQKGPFQSLLTVLFTFVVPCEDNRVTTKCSKEAPFTLVCGYLDQVFVGQSIYFYARRFEFFAAELGQVFKRSQSRRTPQRLEE